MKVEFFRHNLNEEDKNRVRSVLDSLFLTTGETVAAFESAFARYTNSRFCVGVMSCTHALELALAYFNIGSDDEVITTPLSFVATAAAISRRGAIPAFVDVEPSTGNIDTERIESVINERTKAIIPVHLYGQMCDMKAIRAIADRHELKIIEDAAHCLEGSRDGIRVGELADAACFSFYATKNITSGEGGAIICKDEAMYEWLKKARLHGMSKDAQDRYTKRYEHYDVEFLGSKCNMTNIQAALLLGQLQRIWYLWHERERVWQTYERQLDFGSRLARPTMLQESVHAYHQYTIWIDSTIRDSMLHSLQDHQIGIGIHFRPIHLMRYYQDTLKIQPGSFPHAERIGASTISLPTYPNLTEEEISYVTENINQLTT